MAKNKATNELPTFCKPVYSVPGLDVHYVPLETDRVRITLPSGGELDITATSDGVLVSSNNLLAGQLVVVPRACNVVRVLVRGLYQ